jgi:hypothetical protein
MELIDVNWEQLQKLHFAYIAWDEALRSTSWSARGANLPEALSEAVTCIATGSKLIRGGHGDLQLPTGKIGEAKATSKAGKDLSSFSPTSEFDNLYFVQLLTEAPNKHIYEVYDLKMNRKQIELVQVSKKQTFGDQARAGRRPRFSIYRTLIKPVAMRPSWTVDVGAKVVTPIR